MQDKRDERQRRDNAAINADEGEAWVDYRILYDQVVDTVEIHYAEWAHLQLTGMVDVYKYQHL